MIVPNPPGHGLDRQLVACAIAEGADEQHEAVLVGHREAGVVQRVCDPSPGQIGCGHLDHVHHHLPAPAMRGRGGVPARSYTTVSNDG